MSGRPYEDHGRYLRRRSESRGRYPESERGRSARGTVTGENSRPEEREERSHRHRSRSRHRSRDRKKRGHTKDDRSRSISGVRSPDRERERHKRRRSRSISSSSDSTEGRKHKKKKSEKRRERSRSRERKERKREKKEEKKERKKKKSGAVTAQWGKYGIINESDIYTKEEEFRAWLVEECKINPEVMNKEQTRKQFARFVEDYNTATLPHEKFYNMQRYEARMSLLRNGEFVPQGDEDTYDPNADFRAHSSAHKRTAVEHESYLSKEQLHELRRVQHERVEIAKRKQLGLEIKQSLGVRMDGNAFEE